MKYLIMITLVLVASTTQAQSKTSNHEKQNATTVRTAKRHLKPAATHTQTTASTPATDLSGYIGTNDFYLALIREGVKRT